MNRRAALALVLPALLAAAPAVARSDPDPAPQDSYAPLPALTASVVRSNGRRGMMTVECGLDAPNPALRLRADQSTPRLRAALGMVVRRHAASLRGNRPPDVERLLSDLQAAVDEVIGRSGVRLLIGTVMVS